MDALDATLDWRGYPEFDADRSRLQALVGQEDPAILRAALELHDATAVSGFRDGWVYLKLLRGLMLARDRLALAAEHRKWLARPLDVVNVAAFGFGALPRHVFPPAQRLRIRLFPGKDPARQRLASMYRSAIDPMHALELVSGMRQQLPFMGFGRDKRSNCTYGFVVGLDLLQSDDGVVFIESNSNVGQSDHWLLDYDRNPFTDNMLAFAKATGHRRVRVINNDRGLHPIQVRQYRESMERIGIDVEVIEPASIPMTSRPRSATVPLDRPSDTLTVRIRNFRSLSYFLTDDKRRVPVTLRDYFRERGIAGMVFPGLEDDWISNVRWHSGRFPNLVSKLADVDRGVGVVFLKARDQAHAEVLVQGLERHRRTGGLLGRLVRRRSSGRHLLQPYLITRVFDGRYLANFRTNVLITPLGCRVLSIVRLRTTVPLPEHLDFGVVADPMPFLANGAGDAVDEVPSKDEVEQITPLATHVGNALAESIKKHFDVSI
jgi:hypothetical protein